MSPLGYMAGNCEVFQDFYVAAWGPGSGLDTLKTLCCHGLDGSALAITDDQYITGFALNFGPEQAFLWTPGKPDMDIIGYRFGKPQVSQGLGVSGDGWVAGWGIVDPVGTDTAPQVWTNIRNMIQLTDYGQATGIDQSHNVVGWHRTGPGGPSTAFIWNRTTGLQDLPGLTPGGQSAAVAINQVNQILGWAIDSTNTKRTVIWNF